MPRRQSIPRMTKYQTIPANRTTARFTAKLMSDGKRNLSDRILRAALARAEAQSHRPGLEVLEAALRNATPIIEVKPRRVGGATYQVPVEVRPRRANTLAIRWIIGFARARREKTMAERLAGELLDAANGLGASVKRRDDLQKMAESNKAFAHYRW
jgi:small subunit ribosomal protein S7